MRPSRLFLNQGYKRALYAKYYCSVQSLLTKYNSVMMYKYSSNGNSAVAVYRHSCRYVFKKGPVIVYGIYCSGGILS